MRKRRVATKPMTRSKVVAVPVDDVEAAYDAMAADIGALIQASRHATAHAVNAAITTTYWQVGRRLVEFEQQGRARAAYGEGTLRRLSSDLRRFGRGYSVQNLQQMRLFYLAWPIYQTLSGNSQAPTFALPWSTYVRLLSLQNPEARTFYEAEALRGGWSVRQLDRQIATQFYERSKRATDKAERRPTASERPGDAPTLQEETRDPYILEFLDLKDEYAESDLEEALVERIEDFLLELGGDFAFIGRQRRLRIDDSWFRVDLVFFNRRLRCLVLVDLKVGKVVPGDIGQMNMYVNYAREHWTRDGESPPVGLVLGTTRHSHAVARYTLEGLETKVMAAHYETVLPDTKLIEAEIEKVKRALELPRPKAGRSA